MGTRKTLVKARAGVRLQRIEHLARQQVVQSSWQLSTLRKNQPRSFADEVEAEDAFDMEVIASLTDPIIIDMQRRGLIDCEPERRRSQRPLSAPKPKTKFGPLRTFIAAGTLNHDRSSCFYPEPSGGSDPAGPAARSGT